MHLLHAIPASGTGSAVEDHRPYQRPSRTFLLNRATPDRSLEGFIRNGVAAKEKFCFCSVMEVDMAERSRGFEDAAGQVFISGAQHADLTVWAYCEVADCGGVAPLDLMRWPQGRRFADNLTSLETRMRCICGARRARLSPIRPDATYRRVTIYPFS